MRLCKSCCGYLSSGHIPNDQPIKYGEIQTAIVARMCTDVLPTEVVDVAEEANVSLHKLGPGHNLH